MADKVEELRAKAQAAMAPMSMAPSGDDQPPHDPSPNIPSTQASGGGGKPAPVKGSFLPVRGKSCRVIRVKTEEGAVAIINADDYDPEMKGHTAITPEDEKWGKMAVEARQRADYEAEKVAAIKRVVRGG
jgi:hypothetical protein